VSTARPAPSALKPSLAGNPTLSSSVLSEEPKSISPNAKGRVVVSHVTRTRRTGSALPCPRCRTTMDEVVSIAPVAGEPGLTAYECPNCGYVTSVLEQSKDAR
jgi:predicted RNA-binding Zn-ribbon protein involved in translation (DUF1610 family)